MAKKERRAFIKVGLGAWVAPMVMAVSIPSHAQTSACLESDVVGVWGLSIQNPAMLGSQNYTLSAGGTGTFNGSSLTWSNSGNNLTINLSDGSVMSLQLFDGCNSASGTITEQGGGTYPVFGAKDGFAN